MQTVKIITDSASDLPEEIFKKYNVSMLPMGIVVGDKTYLDRTELDLHTLFQIMDENPSCMPKTVMPTAGAIGEEFRKNLHQYKHQIFVSISSKGSGTYNIANMVKNEIEEQSGKPSNITLVDSLSFSAGYGFSVAEMARVAYEGGEFDEVMEVYYKIREKTEVFLIVDDLKHLQRGGRLNPSVAFVGEMLGIKPILTIQDGLLDSFGKARGKRRGIEQLAEILLEKVTNPNNTRVWVVHTSAPDDAELLKQMVLSKITPKDITTAELGPCIGSHTGKGLVGVVFNT
ncbi:MAG: DegV family protein [Firmicutes bacterium]|nr:DegV family protein [Bacillota bacterium]